MRVEANPLPAAIPWPALAGIIATVSVFAVAQGLSYPLLSFILERQGHSSMAIGLSAAMMPVGLVASSFLIPPAVERFGPGTVALVSAAIGGIALALIGWTQNIVAWFPLRFLTGAVIGPLYVMSEVWIIALAPPARRGRVLGIYASAISAGFAIGPLSLILVGSHGWPPFLVGISAFAGCFLCLLATLPHLPAVQPPGEKGSVLGFVRLAPVLSLCVAACAAIEQVVFSLLPVYGLGHGVMAREISAVQTVLITGSIALQMPLGILAERWGARRALVVCILGTGVGALAFPLFIGTPAIWPFVFVWGSLAFGIYTLSLAELGQRFSGAMLVAGNAAFALMWGLGGIVGPPSAGGAMDAIGAEGMPLTIAAICLALAAVRILKR